MREGFAEGSAETARTVSLAIAEVDREIVNLVGTDGSRRLDGLPVAAPPEPAFVPVPAAPAVFVNVLVQTPAAASYADAYAPPAASDTYSMYSPFLYYPFASVLIGYRAERPFFGMRTAAVRPHRIPDRPRAR